MVSAYFLPLYYPCAAPTVSVSISLSGNVPKARVILHANEQAVVLALELRGVKILGPIDKFDQLVIDADRGTHIAHRGARIGAVSVIQFDLIVNNVCLQPDTGRAKG